MMTSTATEPAPRQCPELSVAAAAREAGDAWLRAGMYMRNYADMRTDTSSDRIARARGEWGLALLEWVEALIAREAAKDRARARRLALPPSPGPGTSTLPVPVPGAGNRHGPVADLAAELRAARSQVSDREGSYTGIRMGSDQAATDQARSSAPFAPGPVAASYFPIIASLYAAVKVRRLGWADRGPSSRAGRRPAGVLSCMSELVMVTVC